MLLHDRLKQEGVKIDAKRMDESYGRFAWIYDLDGIRLSSGSRCSQSPKSFSQNPPTWHPWDDLLYANSMSLVRSRNRDALSFQTRLHRSRDAFYFTFWITEAELLAMFESP